MDDLPIELRRVEITHTLTMTNKHSADTLSIKSKSLGDILEIERLDLVRSRSSIPGFSSSELVLDERSVSSSSSGSKPRLVKQKSCVEETGLDNPEDTAIENLIKDLPNFSCQSLRRRNVPLKQSSMNEELMSVDRLEEKERVRRNIMKQASLNEELICKWRTFEALKDSISPVNASRRFQLLKNGLTSKIKRSTTNIEKVSSMSIKNGFVRMLQGWKSGENESVSVTTTTTTETTTISKPADNKTQPVAVMKRSIEGVERRLSREDGSDSSKDSSLQSDTSVDSEDSFASVIFVPKPADVAAPAAPSSTASSSTTNEVPSAPRPAALQFATTSAPPSPRVKQPPETGLSSRFKVIGVSPLLKQQTSTVANTNRLGETVKTVGAETLGNNLSSSRGLCLVPEPSTEPDTAEPDVAPLIRAFSDVTKTREPIANEDDNRKARLNQIKELLIAKPGFATRSRPSFPLVRRASTAASGRLETVTRILPRLLSLELFNPETDDLDSDSSGVSSPESVGSVISVTSDEKYIARKEAEERNKNSAQNAAADEEASRSSNGDDPTGSSGKENVRDDDESPSSLGTVVTTTFENSSAQSPSPSRKNSTSSVENNTSETTELTRDVSQDRHQSGGLGIDAIRRSTSRVLLESGKTISSQSMKLLEAAANVASSLEDAVGAAIQQRNGQSTEQSFSQYSIAQRRNNDANNVWSQSSVRTRAYLKHDRKSASVDLSGYANVESSSDLIRDISRYCQNSSFDIFGVHPTSQTTTAPSSLADVADNNPVAESNTTACWNDCDQVPKETSWIINEAYDKPEREEKLVGAVRSEQPTPGSKTVCENGHSAVLQPNSDRSKYEVQTEDDALRLNPESHEKSKSKFDVAASRFETSGSTTCDAKKTIANPKDESNPKNALNLQSVVDSKSRNVDDRERRCSKTSPLMRSNSDDMMLDFVMVSKTGEGFEDAVELKTSGCANKWHSSQDGLSVGSSDVGDSLMENTTTSLSDGSQAECSTARLFTGSTVSLVSNLNAENNRRSSVERRRLQERGRSLDEMSSEAKKVRDADCLVTTTSTTESMSNASSQESLPSDRGGGSITYHQYYHVFREGELDQLINKYVQNLHIISSYYDHASWCVVAEKVQVWTI